MKHSGPLKEKTASIGLSEFKGVGHPQSKRTKDYNGL